MNKGRMVRLAEYSRDKLVELRADTGIRYDERMRGTLQLFRTRKQLDGIDNDVEVLRANGVPFEVLDQAGCVAAEPALGAVRDLFVGGLRLPNDETGDCYKFTVALAASARAAGVDFRHGVTIRGFRRRGDYVEGVETDAGLEVADTFVAALGSYTPQRLKPLGLTVPVYPVKGYSLTIPIADAARAPESTVMDVQDRHHAPRRPDPGRRHGGDLRLHGRPAQATSGDPGALRDGPLPRRRQGAATFWSGLRPMTPDGTPVIGRTRFHNLVLNTGHGTLGWTMACGSARVLADVVSGTRPKSPSPISPWIATRPESPARSVDRPIQAASLVPPRIHDALLEEAGIDKSRLVAANVYLSDIADSDALNAVYDRWIDPANPPVRACVEARLAEPGLRAEMTAVALL